MPRFNYFLSNTKIPAQEKEKMGSDIFGETGSLDDLGYTYEH